MNINKIKKRREMKDKLIKVYYKIVSPIARSIEKIEKRKFNNLKNKAMSLTPEEFSNLLANEVIRHIKKTGKFNRDIILCEGCKDFYSYDEYTSHSLNGFIEYLGKENKLLYYCTLYNDNMYKQIDTKEQILNLLMENLNKIEGINVEFYIDKDNFRLYENYRKTLKIYLTN